MDPDQTDKFDINVPDAAPETGPTPEVGWSLDKGTVRENNEDSLAAVTLNQASETESQSIGVYMVADGMGGHEAGEVASKLAVRTAVRQLMGAVAETDTDMPENYREWLEGAVALANQVVHKKAHEENKNMGTTLVMAVVVGNDVHIANVGDSRAYLISPMGIRQITRDQSLVQSFVDKGVITPEEAVNHPRRNILTQAIGSSEDVTIDVFNETLGDDESMLLCSDGLWDTLGDEEILRLVRTAATPSAACQALVDTCNAKGSRDNIAAVLVRPGAAPQPSLSDTPS
jgi:serine/threonine protein phosphatase PrpC